MAFETAVMMGGCPHCGDGEPRIVTFHHRKSSDKVHYVGDWKDEEKSACLKYGELKIIACRPIDNEDDQDDA